MDRLLPLRSVCEVLAVPKAVVQVWLGEGFFPPPVQLPNGRLRWRQSAVMAWIADLAAHKVDAEKLDVEDLPELAQDIYQALQEQGRWVFGKELPDLVGVEDDHRSGKWYRALEKLKKAGLIESCQRRGYRAIPQPTTDE